MTLEVRILLNELEKSRDNELKLLRVLSMTLPTAPQEVKKKISEMFLSDQHKLIESSIGVSSDLL